MTQIAEEEVNLSSLNWKFLKLFFLSTFEEWEDVIEVQETTNFTWQKNKEHNNRQKLCLYLATDSRSESTEELVFCSVNDPHLYVRRLIHM